MWKFRMENVLDEGSVVEDKYKTTAMRKSFEVKYTVRYQTRGIFQLYHEKESLKPFLVEAPL